MFSVWYSQSEAVVCSRRCSFRASGTRCWFSHRHCTNGQRRERHIHLVSIMGPLLPSSARMVGPTGGKFGNSFRKTSIGSSCPKLETDVRPRWKSNMVWVKVGRKLRGTPRGTDAVPDEDCGIVAMDRITLRNGRFSVVVSWGCSILFFSRLKMASTSSGESTRNAESTPTGDDFNGISVMGCCLARCWGQAGRRSRP